MKKYLLLFLLIAAVPGLMPWANAQRYYEFHFPAGKLTNTSADNTGKPGTENFIVKMTDTALFPKIESDLLLPDSLKQYIIIGWVDTGNGGYNYDWVWHYNPDTMMVLSTGAYEVCDGISSEVDDYQLDDNPPLFCPWYARVKGAVSLLAIKEIRARNQVTGIYPNPVVAGAILRLKHSYPDFSLIIYNTLGQAIRASHHLSGHKAMIRKDDLKPGIYFARIRVQGQSIGGCKFLIE